MTFACWSLESGVWSLLDTPPGYLELFAGAHPDPSYSNPYRLLYSTARTVAAHHTRRVEVTSEVSYEPGPRDSPV